MGNFLFYLEHIIVLLGGWHINGNNFVHHFSQNDAEAESVQI